MCHKRPRVLICVSKCLSFILKLCCCNFFEWLKCLAFMRCWSLMVPPKINALSLLNLFSSLPVAMFLYPPAIKSFSRSHQHGLYSPWNSPVQDTGVGSLSLLQGIFPNQGLNPGLPHCRWILYQLSHRGSLRILEWVAYPFSSGSSQPRN